MIYYYINTPKEVPPVTRIARVVVPGCPHHIIQRGNRKQQVFFYDEDRELYLSLLKHYSKKAGLNIWSYCLMDNHVHIIAAPTEVTSLRKGFAETHRRYTLEINRREGWSGYLWHGRFISFPMDEKYLYCAMRYVELNPVRAGLVKRPEDYPWSSARVRVLKQKDELLSDNCMTHQIHDWSAYLAEGDKRKDLTLLRKHSRTNKPLGL